ncbi:MAG TPA: YgiQ family radical SAM protein [Polyangiaceae bacterium]|nr:YgiQ family radical SAM protein [Polyangiaceae bacterium]
MIHQIKPRQAMPREPRFLPMDRSEMRSFGWDALDVLLVSGDAYVDHPAFGVAVIARCLHSLGLRVGVVAQPRWDRIDDITAMGAPRLFVGVTAGNLDSMLNKLTAQKKTRSLDAYSPAGEPGQRPNRATIVYAQLCRQAFPGIPIVLGGIEASLRRIAHYDFWSDSVRRSVVLDSKAELLVFGMGESTIVSVAEHLRSGADIASLKRLRGTAYGLSRRELWEPLLKEQRAEKISDSGIVALPSYEEACADPKAFSRMTRLFEREMNPFNARPMIQPHGNEAVYLNPPSKPLSSGEYDAVYALPFQRQPHPRYASQRIPAFETVRDSVVALRGCYGGCSFCSISEHAGRIVQNRSEASILRELQTIAQSEGFHGTISDLGGPTANMYRTGCRAAEFQHKCRRGSCLYPRPCPHLDVNQDGYVALLRKARRTRGIRHVFIASGIRYDLANLSAPFIEELASYHVGGQLSVAPEHVASNTLRAMRKPEVESYERFVAQFQRQSQRARREQYVVPYFVVGHPGTSLSDAVELAVYLKRAGIRPRQVQEFIPTPMTVATSMYYTGLDPLNDKPVYVERSPRARRLQKALALYYDETQAALVREALIMAKRADLIGVGADCLVHAERINRPYTGEHNRGVRASRQINRGNRPRNAR